MLAHMSSCAECWPELTGCRSCQCRLIVMLPVLGNALNSDTCSAAGSALPQKLSQLLRWTPAAALSRRLKWSAPYAPAWPAPALRAKLLAVSSCACSPRCIKHSHVCCLSAGVRYIQEREGLDAQNARATFGEGVPCRPRNAKHLPDAAGRACQPWGPCQMGHLPQWDRSLSWL